MSFNQLLWFCNIISAIGVLAQIIGIIKITLRLDVPINVLILIIGHQVWIIIHCISRFVHEYFYYEKFIS